MEFFNFVIFPYKGFTTRDVLTFSLYGIIQNIILIKYFNKMRMRFLCNKDQCSSKQRYDDQGTVKQFSYWIKSVMIQDKTIMIGALASRRMLIIYAICTLVISVVIRVTRPDVENRSIFLNENS